ncbi:uncharacterized protein LOC127262745 [Andrographis paniculata]|uniref:uncharacterized protein LOC127262745 n=1 Tax=Andrographis paniculata TaxID=175694 RepID=UPI0021E826D0|nr:uncharacterized protein LOC127262745 [Andrographis paniculata]
MSIDSSASDVQSLNAAAQVVTSMAHLELHPSDQPGMSLITTQLNDTNYLLWSRGIMRALIAKGKEGFITGKISKPNDVASAIVWRKTDNMILQWILNSIASHLTDAFGYVSTSHELWEYGQCNGPLIYRLRREISGLSQGGLSLVTYFTKLKKLKDELRCLAPMPETKNEMDEYINKQDIIDYLMGLNDSYDAVRSQIQMMDPLPSLNNVYGILSNVEKQQKIHGMLHETHPTILMSFHKHAVKVTDKRKIDKRSIICEHCKKTCHNKDTCFKLNGTPDWYKAIQERRKSEMKGAYIVTEQQTAMQVADDSGSSVFNPLLSTDSLAELIQREIQKAFMKAKTPPDHLNMLEVEHAGKEFMNLYTDFDDKCLWILDSGATCHVSNNLSLFKHLKLLKKPAKIHLPNGTT